MAQHGYLVARGQISQAWHPAYGGSALPCLETHDRVGQDLGECVGGLPRPGGKSSQ